MSRGLVLPRLALTILPEAVCLVAARGSWRAPLDSNTKPAKRDMYKLIIPNSLAKFEATPSGLYSLHLVVHVNIYFVLGGPRA